MQEYIVQGFKNLKILNRDPETLEDCLSGLKNLAGQMGLAHNPKISDFFQQQYSEQQDPAGAIYYQLTGITASVGAQECQTIYQLLQTWRAQLQLHEQDSVEAFYQSAAQSRKEDAGASTEQQTKEAESAKNSGLIAQLLQELEEQTLEGALDVIRTLKQGSSGPLIDRLIVTPVQSQVPQLFPLVSRWFQTKQQNYKELDAFLTALQSHITDFHKNFGMNFYQALRKCAKDRPSFTEPATHELLTVPEQLQLSKFIFEHFQLQTQRPLQFFAFMTAMEENVKQTSGAQPGTPLSQVVIQYLNGDTLKTCRALGQKLCGSSKQYDSAQNALDDFVKQVRHFDETHIFSAQEMASALIPKNESLLLDQNAVRVFLPVQQVEQIQKLGDQLGLTWLKEIKVAKDPFDNEQPLLLLAMFVQRLNDLLLARNHNYCHSLIENLDAFQAQMEQQTYMSFLCIDESSKGRAYKDLLAQLKNIEKQFRNGSGLGSIELLIHQHLKANEERKLELTQAASQVPQNQSKYAQLILRHCGEYLIPGQLFAVGFTPMVSNAIMEFDELSLQEFTQIFFTFFGTPKEFKGVEQFTSTFGQSVLKHMHLFQKVNKLFRQFKFAEISFENRVLRTEVASFFDYVEQKLGFLPGMVSNSKHLLLYFQKHCCVADGTQDLVGFYKILADASEKDPVLLCDDKGLSRLAKVLLPAQQVKKIDYKQGSQVIFDSVTAQSGASVGLSCEDMLQELRIDAKGPLDKLTDDIVLRYAEGKVANPSITDFLGCFNALRQAKTSTEPK